MRYNLVLEVTGEVETDNPEQVKELAQQYFYEQFGKELVDKYWIQIESDDEDETN